MGLRIFGQGIGGARHALDATGDDAIRLAQGNLPRRDVDRREAARAQTVDRQAGDLVGHPGEQSGHARDVAVVFAGLIGATEDDLVHCFGGAGGAFQGGLNHLGGQIIGTDTGERAADAPDRRANGGEDTSRMRVRQRFTLGGTSIQRMDVNEYS